MRKKIVAGNWKMNMDYSSGLTLFSEILDRMATEPSDLSTVVVCVPFTSLHSVARLAKEHNHVFIGAQNCHEAETGAFTGEISAAMIRSVGAEYVIIGHSERRQYFGEKDAILGQKIKTAINNKLIPIFCIGETLDHRKNKLHFQVVRDQLTQGLFHTFPNELKDDLVIAYEPVWAIGTGLTASPDQVQEMHSFIRNELIVQYGQKIASGLSLLYGGSCNTKNAADIFSQAEVDGGLIGGASLKAQDFVDIVKALNA